MRKELREIAKIEQFLNGDLSPKEADDFEKEIVSNHNLKREVETQRLIQEGILSIALKQEAIKAYQKYQVLRFFKIFGLPILVILASVAFVYLNNDITKSNPIENPTPVFSDTSKVNKDKFLIKESEFSEDNVIGEPYKDTLFSSESKFTGPINDIIIEAEDYTAYKDMTPENLGNVLSKDSVDIYKLGDAVVIGHTLPNEWLEYTIDIKQEGEYEILLIVASGQDNVLREIDLTINDKFLKTVKTPFTGSWFDYKEISFSNYQFSKGLGQKLKLDFKTGWNNIDKIILRYSENNSK